MIKRPFSYFGSKHAIAHLYPLPRYDVIVEPFAGSAGYSCLYGDRKVKLYDIDVNIAAAWRYLIDTDIRDVIKLPLDHKLVGAEARALVGFWLANGRTAPAEHASGWMLSGDRPNAYWGVEARNKVTVVADQVKHWTFDLLSWEKIPSITCTWFIDPPYWRAGCSYRENKVDYDALGAWVRELKGQVIVCEEAGATWLPFVPLGATRCSGKKWIKEVVYVQAN